MLLNEAISSLSAHFQVCPSCYDDELLLSNLTSLINEMLHVVESNSVDGLEEISEAFLLWFLQDCVLSSDKSSQILGNGSPLLKVLESSEPQPEPMSSSNDAHLSSMTVRRQLCKKILSLLSRTARMVLSQRENEVSLVLIVFFEPHL